MLALAYLAATRAREHQRDPDPDLLTALTAWVTDGQPGLADLGYQGESDTLTVPVKKPKNATLSIDQQTYNTVHAALRCLGERANSLLRTTYKALRRYRGCP